MAITIEEFNRRIDEALPKIINRMLDATERAALSAKAMINNRIVQKGESATGSPLLPYTPRYLQFKKDVGRYRGHVDLQLGNYSINKRISAVKKRRKEATETLNIFNTLAGFKTNKKKKLTKKQINEKKLAELQKKKERRARAIPTGGTLWRNIGLTEKKEDNGVITIVVGGTDELNKLKLEGLSIKRGDILALNEQEYKVTVDRVREEATQIVNEELFIK